MSADLDKPPAVIRWPKTSIRTDITRLHTAVLVNKPKKIIKYVRRGASVDAYNNDCQPPIFCAALLGKWKVVKTLLELGANPNARCYPDGCTPVHGACYVGCTKSLKLLLNAGGDLRLTDTQRRTPLDWCLLQIDEVKRIKIRDVLDGARLVAFKSTNGREMLKEMDARIALGGTGKNMSPPTLTAPESLPMRILKSTIACCPVPSLPSPPRNVTSEVTLNNVIPIGFGKVYFGNDPSHSQLCGAVQGLPLLNGISDIKLDEDSTSASWICGKFSTFVPMIWIKLKMSVHVRELRKSTVDDAIPDILISELNALTKFRHPNLLMCLAICHVDNFDSISLVFEKTPLGSLYFVLYNQMKRLSSRFVTEILAQICEALDYIHNSGYLHNFINSHSIFLLDNTRAKLGCLEYITPIGASPEAIKLASHPHLRSDTHLSICRHWTAPEILSGKRPPSKTSDIYSICSIMWELIYGEVPWKDYSLEELRLMMTENPYARLPLDKAVVPHMWYGILTVGLEPESPLRDVDLFEVRDMMKLSQSKIDLGYGSSASSSAGMNGGGDAPLLKKSRSRSSMQYDDQDALDSDVDDKSKLFQLSLLGPHTAV